MIIHPSLLLAVFGLIDAISAIGPEVCYDELGCFSLLPPYSLFEPWSPEVIGTKFLLFTRFNQFSEEILSYDDPSTIASSRFEPWKKTKIIVHGFNSDGDSKWVPKMKNAILNNENVNVIVVDWRNGADPINYAQAASNTRMVGAQIGYLIKIIMETTGASAGSFHIIGHSLGAHTAGYAGDWMRKDYGATLGRITGMDAAGPLYEGTNTLVRLDPMDAHFVDAIHTDGDPITNLGWGIYQTVGHADFYPNGGVDQPGCWGNDVESGGIWRVSCSHSRSHELFTDSIINKDRPMYGYRCNNYAEFESGVCNDCPAQGCPVMGYYSDSVADSSEFVKYYLTTGSEAPFAST